MISALFRTIYLIVSALFDNVSVDTIYIYVRWLNIREIKANLSLRLGIKLTVPSVQELDFTHKDVFLM